MSVDTIPPASIDPELKAMLLRELGKLSRASDETRAEFRKLNDRFDRESRRIDALGYRADEAEERHRQLEARHQKATAELGAKIDAMAASATRIEGALGRIEALADSDRTQTTEIDRLKLTVKLLFYIAFAGGAGGGAAKLVGSLIAGAN